MPFPLTLDEEAAGEEAAGEEAADEHALTAEMNVAAAKSLGAIRLDHQIGRAVDEADEQILFGKWSAKVSRSAVMGEVAVGAMQDEEVTHKLEQTLPLDLTPPAKLPVTGAT